MYKEAKWKVLIMRLQTFQLGRFRQLGVVIFRGRLYQGIKLLIKIIVCRLTLM